MFFIILCSYRPRLEYFRQQIESLQRQTDGRFRCLVQDDGSAPETLRAMQELLAADERFTLRKNVSRLGVYHNFESGLVQTPPDAEFVCYCDQDDIWESDKLARQRAVFADPEVVLCHSDLALIDAAGQTIHPSCFAFEGRNVTDYSLPQLVLRNSVTGCTVAFRARLQQRLLPFPHQGETPAYHHDLWTVLNATQVGRIVVIAAPLVRYRQHAGNVIGALTAADPRVGAAAPRKLTEVWPYVAATANDWKLRQHIVEQVLQRATPAARPEARLDTLRGFAERVGSLHFLQFASEQSPPKGRHAELARWLVRGRLLVQSRYVPGPPRSVLELPRRTLWRLRTSRPGQVAGKVRRQLTALLPPPWRYQAQPVALPPRPRFPALPLRAAQTGPGAYNVVLPNLDERSLFGGIATALKLAVELARRGRKVRLISVDRPLAAPQIERLETILGRDFGVDPQLAQSFEYVDAAIPDAAHPDAAAKPLWNVSPEDRFIATAWWTALRVRNTLRTGHFTHRQFIYLIQDYEPGFYAWSPDYAYASASYGKDYVPIYNTQLLAEFFRSRGVSPVREDLILEPQVDWARYAPPAAAVLQARRRRRIFVYGRPQTPRNLYALIEQGLVQWLAARRLGAADVEVVAAGEDFDPVRLSPEVMLRSLGKLTLLRYAEELRNADLGISLMLSPHPSYPPFEMLASGLVTITNRFENKDALSFGLGPHPNLIFCDPTEEALVEALDRAWARVGDTDARIAGAKLDVRALGRSVSEVTTSLLGHVEGATAGAELHW